MLPVVRGSSEWLHSYCRRRGEAEVMWTRSSFVAQGKFVCRADPLPSNHLAHMASDGAQEFDAPFLFVKSWQELPAILSQEQSKLRPEDVVQKR